MIPYFSGPPFSQHPVRPALIAFIAAELLLFAAGFYFLGLLLTMRLMLVGMILGAVAMWVFFFRRVAQALRRKELRTAYGTIVMADRPMLFTTACAVLLLMPPVLLSMMIFYMSPDVQLLQWIRGR